MSGQSQHIVCLHVCFGWIFFPDVFHVFGNFRCDSGFLPNLGTRLDVAGILHNERSDPNHESASEEFSGDRAYGVTFLTWWLWGGIVAAAVSTWWLQVMLWRERERKRMLESVADPDRDVTKLQQPIEWWPWLGSRWSWVCSRWLGRWSTDKQRSALCTPAALSHVRVESAWSANEKKYPGWCV